MQNVSKLGFGMMRLPMNGADIDLVKTQEMVDAYMAAGGNYFDTSVAYNGGKSERAIYETVVKKYPRDSFYIATKLPAWLGPKNADEAKAMFDTSLDNLKCGYFDFYLLHNLGDTRTQLFEDWGIWEYLKEKKEQGLIRHLGFSIHDTADALEEVLIKHPEAEFVQLQINYVDWEDPSIQSRKCYEIARKYNKPVIIKEPVKGGSLANFPSPAADYLTALDPNASLASWAVRFAADLPGVLTVLSGMSTLEQVKDNLNTMKNIALTDEQRAALFQAADALNAMPRIPCTECAYCVKGCPMDIPIPDIFSCYNTITVYNNTVGAQRTYNMVTARHGKPGDCIACGRCESACPQHISIINQLKIAKKELEK